MNKKLLATISILVLVGLILLSLTLWDKEVEKSKQGLTEYHLEKDEEAKQDAKEREEEISTYSELAQRLYHDDVESINLIGDSITAGVGVPSQSFPDDGRIIYEDDEYEFRESNHTGETWANGFRTYIHSNFMEIDFLNSGIGGRSTEWAVEHQSTWLSDNEDVVFVMLGTNDRLSGDLDLLNQNLRSFLSFVDDNSNTMVVMSPPPASSDVEYEFGAKEINELVKRISEENNYTFISHYEHFNEYVEENDIEMTDLIHPDGTHPIEKGYHEMWRHIKSELDLDKITN